jgi:hypothetical protein
MMDTKEIEHAVISNAVDTLSVLCAGNRDMIIDLLTGYLWDEEEAGGIKNSTGKFEILP